MAAYADFQAKEFAAEKHGYTATKHQREVGAGYFDEVTLTLAGEGASTVRAKGLTEEAQFH